MKCLICGNSRFDCIHNGTRDIPEIDVIQCTECGMVQLDNNKYNTEQDYSKGGMLKKSYSITTDKTENKEWKTWLLETDQDDNRRYKTLKHICAGKSVLEFGCGNGGFLRKIKNVASNVAGIELMDEAREYITKSDGIKVYQTIDAIEKNYDVVCMFMVIEHLNDPDEVLKKIHKILNPDGIFICETPNANDALISKYECRAFENFTYWSKHVILFNSNTLERIITRNGFKTRLNTQIQRYSLANHLYWLAKGKAGGHMKWSEFNGNDLNYFYASELVKLKIADTLWYIGDKSDSSIMEQENYGERN